MRIDLLNEDYGYIQVSDEDNDDLFDVLNAIMEESENDEPDYLRAVAQTKVKNDDDVDLGDTSILYLLDGNGRELVISEEGDEELFDLISALVEEAGAVEPHYGSIIYSVIGETKP